MRWTNCPQHSGLFSAVIVILGRPAGKEGNVYELPKMREVERK
jgi:hypothetical protein